jgi:hypothetical protein
MTQGSLEFYHAQKAVGAIDCTPESLVQVVGYVVAEKSLLKPSNGCGEKLSVRRAVDLCEVN